MNKLAYLGKIVLLLVLIVIVLFIGILVFDWIGITSLRQRFLPTLPFIGGKPVIESPTEIPETVDRNQLDLFRQRKALQAIEEQNIVIEQREGAVETQAEENALEREELRQLREEIEEQQNSLIIAQQNNDNRERRLVQQADLLTGMPPESAVAQMNEMELMTLIDVLRTVETVSVQRGENSLVPYWISLMPPERAAEVSQGMIDKPEV